MAAHLEILVEELSMEAALQLVVPRIIGESTFSVYPHQCKQDLLNKLPERLRGYAAWLPEDWKIMVIVDRDDDRCEELKQHLEITAEEAGLRARRHGRRGGIQIMNRLAIEE